jgi:hypothetical protein
MFRFQTCHFVYSHPCANSVWTFIIQSHITHHCFCTLHLYISCQIPISLVQAQTVVLNQRAFAKRCRTNICPSLEVRRPSLMARGVKIIFQVNSALTRMAGYLRLQVSFSSCDIPCGATCAFTLCKRSQLCTSWWHFQYPVHRIRPPCRPCTSSYRPT